MNQPFHELDAQQQAALMREAGVRALARHWGITDAQPELLKYRENAVFRVDHDGQRSALRVHRYGYHSDDALRSELQWIKALDEAGIAAPEALATRDGALFAVAEAPGLPGPVQVDRFAWIDGAPLGSVEGGLGNPAAVAEIYPTIGALAAQVHNQASGWKPPAGFVRHSWDADGLAGADPLWGRFWELDEASVAERRLMRRCRDRIHAELSKRTRSADEYSMIHADFAPENLLVDGDKVHPIDFDDAGFGWHLFELATALYFIHREPFFDTAQEALIAGYREHRELTDRAVADLPVHFVARAFTYVGWVHTRRGTETAQELTPMLLDMALTLADDYLSGQR